MTMTGKKKEKMKIILRKKRSREDNSIERLVGRK